MSVDVCSSGNTEPVDLQSPEKLIASRMAIGTMLAVLFSLPVVFGLPIAYPLACVTPIVAAMTTPRMRAVQVSICLGMLLMWWGTHGEVSYLGVVDISDATFQYALLFGSVFSIVVLLVSGFSFMAGLENMSGVLVPRSLHYGLLIVACGLLLARLSYGVSLLEGNEARLEVSVAPIVGFASGSVAMAVAFVQSGRGWMIRLLQVLLCLLALGTASRLLVVAVLLGCLMANRSEIRRLERASRGLVTVCAVAIALLSSVLVFRIRTDSLALSVQEQRVESVSGFSGFLINNLGSSFYWASRNGLSVNEIVVQHGITPPFGFVGGAVMNVAGLLPEDIPEPEVWLTGALGFSRSAVGAIATPLWSGLLSDYGWELGLIGTGIFAVLVVCYARVVIGSTVWLAVGVGFSFYGSYLVSFQFLGASAILFAISVVVRVARSRSRGEKQPAGLGVLEPHLRDSTSEKVANA